MESMMVDAVNIAWFIMVLVPVAFALAFVFGRQTVAPMRYVWRLAQREEAVGPRRAQVINPPFSRVLYCITIPDGAAIAGRTLQDVGMGNLARVTVALVVVYLQHDNNTPMAVRQQDAEDFIGRNEYQNAVVTHEGHIVFLLPGADTPLPAGAEVYLCLKDYRAENIAPEGFDIRNFFVDAFENPILVKYVRMAFEKTEFAFTKPAVVGPRDIVAADQPSLDLRHDTRINAMGKVSKDGDVTWNIGLNSHLNPGDHLILATYPMLDSQTPPVLDMESQLLVHEPYASYTLLHGPVADELPRCERHIQPPTAAQVTQ